MRWRFTLTLLDVMTFGLSANFAAVGCLLALASSSRSAEANVRLRGHPHVQLHSRFRKRARGFANAGSM
jgi:hypothetical protein